MTSDLHKIHMVVKTRKTYEDMLRSVQLPTKEEISETTVEFSDIWQADLIGTLKIEGVAHQYFVVTTDQGTFITMSEFGEEIIGHHFPNMSISCRRKMFEYIVEHPHLAGMCNNAAHHLERIKEIEDMVKKREQIYSKFPNISAIYCKIADQLASKNVHEYRNIAIWDIGCISAIKEGDVDGFVSNWNKLSSILHNDLQVDSELILELNSIVSDA